MPVQVLCNLIQIDFIETEGDVIFILVYILVNVFADLYSLNHLNIDVSVIFLNQERTVWDHPFIEHYHLNIIHLLHHTVPILTLSVCWVSILVHNCVGL